MLKYLLRRCDAFVSEDSFLVLASDGVYDVMSNQDLVDFVATMLLGEGRLIPGRYRYNKPYHLA